MRATSGLNRMNRIITIDESRTDLLHKKNSKKTKLKNKIKSITLTYSRYQFRKRVESIKNRTTTFRDKITTTNIFIILQHSKFWWNIILHYPYFYQVKLYLLTLSLFIVDDFYCKWVCFLYIPFYLYDRLHSKWHIPSSYFVLKENVLFSFSICRPKFEFKHIVRIKT